MSIRDTNFVPGTVPGLPTEEQTVAWYAEVSGYDPRPDLAWGSAFSIFRLSCIMQGIAARYAVRQASSALAKENGRLMGPFGDFAWRLVGKARDQGGERSRL